jgi:integrase/recombinase XerD
MRNKQHNNTFQQDVKAFTRRRILEGKAAASSERMAGLVLSFLVYCEKHFGTKTGLEITQRMVDSYMLHLSHLPNQRKQGGLADTYINKHREAILRYVEYKYGVDIGESSIRILYLKAEHEAKTVLTVEVIQHLFSVSDRSILGLTDMVILSMLYGCGLRRSELYTLDVNDIDLHRGEVRLLKTKTRHARVVPMTQSIQKSVEDYLFSARSFRLPEHKMISALLVSSRGRRMSYANIQKRLEYLGKKAHLTVPLSAHLLRHSIATHLNAHLTIEQVAEFLGHTDIDSTQIYTHIAHG